MRLKFLPAFMIAFTAVLFLASCSKKSNTQGRYIPKEAVFAAHINGESLNAKLPWEEVKTNNVFKMAYADSSLDGMAKAAMENPENTGVDIKADMVFFVVKDTTGGYAAFQGKIKDATKFKSYYTTAIKNATASQKDGIDFITSGRMSISWDKDKFIMVTDLPEMNQVKELDQLDTFDSSYKAPSFVSNRNTVEVATAIYALKEDNSLAKDERFSKLVNDKGDLHFWMNIESLYKGMPGMEMLALINLSKLYEDARYAATANFENGQIKIDMTSYAGKELTNLYKKYGGNKINADMAERLPAKDLAVFFAMNFKPEGIKELIKLTGMEGLANMGIASLGFNLDDFIKANKGDLLLAVSDIVVDSFGSPTPKVLFSSAIGDKPSFDKLIAAGNTVGKQQGDAAGISYKRDDKYFVIGNDNAANEQFISGKGGKKPSFWDKISGSPIAGYVNLQAIMNAVSIKETGKDSFGIATLQASKKFWNDIILTGGEFKDGGIVQHVEINLMDKTTNSLKQINKYVDELAVITSKRKESYKYLYEDVKVDTSALIAPVAP